MEFRKFDMVLLVTMGLAVVIMSFIFPALGMSTEDSVNESDIPELQLSSNEWDIAGDFPDDPRTPTSGTITRSEDVPVIGQHIVWIDRPKENGASIELGNFSGDMEIVVQNWTSGSADAVDRYNITNEGQTIYHSNNSWGLQFDVEEFANHAEPNMTATVSWEIVSSPNADEGGGLSSLPVIGGLFSAGEQLALILGWLGTIIRWIVAILVEIIVVVSTTLFTVMVYVIDLISWLANTYMAVISAAPGWSKVFVTVPGILLFGEFAKIAFIGVSLLPST